MSERGSGEIQVGDRLKSIEDKLDKILDGLSGANTRIALIEQKLKLHDRILMGVCSTVGIAIVVALMSKVIA